jgi:hypothetical protein
LRIALTLALLLLTSCAAHQPVTANWRLTKQGTADLLIPPGVARPDLSKRTLAVDLTAGQRICPPPIRVKGKHVFVTVTRDMLLDQPPGWLTKWASGIESQGCIAPGEASILAARIAEALPLDPALAFHLLYPNDRQAGQVDFAPPVRLQVVSPILRDGAAPDATILETSGSGNSITLTVKATDNLIGYETAWYAPQSRAAGVGFTITPLYAERHVNNQTEHRAQPATNYLRFPPRRRVLPALLQIRPDGLYRFRRSGADARRTRRLCRLLRSTVHCNSPSRGHQPDDSRHGQRRRSHGRLGRKRRRGNPECRRTATGIRSAKARHLPAV